MYTTAPKQSPRVCFFLDVPSHSLEWLKLGGEYRGTPSTVCVWLQPGRRAVLVKPPQRMNRLPCNVAESCRDCCSVVTAIGIGIAGINSTRAVEDMEAGVARVP